MDTLRGHLLISNGSLYDPNFRHTVVLIVEHGDEGALGVVLNRPAPITVAEAIPALAPAVEPQDNLYIGGPVLPEAAVVLARSEEVIAPDLPAGEIVEGVTLLGEADLELGPRARLRVFGGHAGWGPGQLESELERNDWIVERALAEDVFTDDPKHLWRAVLERKGHPYTMLATMPFDPSVN